MAFLPVWFFLCGVVGMVGWSGFCSEDNKSQTKVPESVIAMLVHLRALA